ncbi:MAG: CpsD/CapB family tyrosine-protein kinase [Caldisericia bacterium]|nr:CpsD/CapB family tyrosine-protein kinase [Caldisericia bacterium]
MSKKQSSLDEKISLDHLVSKNFTQEENLIVKPFVIEDPNSSYAEAFKILRTNLKFTLKLNQPRSIVITSAMTAEGKTTIASNAAASFAKSGLKVVLVGADMRIPAMFNQFNIENEVGLSNYLNDEVELDKILVNLEYEENLTIIPSGAIPPNSADLLSSEKLLEMIDTLKKSFDLVIFDTPPVNLVADAIIVGPVVDGVLIIVNKGMTKKKDLKLCMERMRFANVVGFVINSSSEKSEGGYYKNNYSKYRSGYGNYYEYKQH